MDVSQSEAPGTDAWSTKVRRRAKQLSGAINRGEMELAEILWNVYDTPIEGDSNRGPVWAGWGFDSFAHYAEEELGLKRRKAERLRQIWMNVEVRLGDRVDRKLKKRLYNLGWTKVREIAPLLTPKNFEKWVTMAEEKTYADLTAHTKVFRERVAEARDRRERIRLYETVEETDEYKEEEDLLDTVEHDKPEMKVMVTQFGMFEEQLETVEQALKQAAQVTGSDKRSRNLSLVCLDFVAHSGINKKGSNPVVRYMARMEKSTGIRIIAVDPETNNVVYGMSTLEQLAAGEENETADNA